jgi:hypothetical protein
MLRHDESEERVAPIPYSPVARRDVMTDAHVEDFLDHRLAPLVGTVSYEERQQMRADLRQEIESIVAAHEELGSTHDQAVALALRGLTTPVAAVNNQGVASRTTDAPAAGRKASLPVALRAFGAAGAASLALAYAFNHSSGDVVPTLFSLILVVFPLLAGIHLGAKNARHPFSGLLKAQLLLYAPITLIFFLMVNSESHSDSIDMRLGLFTAAYTAISTAVGCAGVPLGAWLRRTLGRRRKALPGRERPGTMA